MSLSDFLFAKRQCGQLAIANVKANLITTETKRTEKHTRNKCNAVYKDKQAACTEYFNSVTHMTKHTLTLRTLIIIALCNDT